MKRGKHGTNYFGGFLTDGNESMRMVGCDENVQRKLLTLNFKEKGSPVKIEKCHIKKEGTINSNRF